MKTHREKIMARVTAYVDQIVDSQDVLAIGYHDPTSDTPSPMIAIKETYKDQDVVTKTFHVGFVSDLLLPAFSAMVITKNKGA